MSRDIAILSGDGQLPVLLQNELPQAILVAFDGMVHQLGDKPVIEAQFEHLGALFDGLKKRGVKLLVMAGTMSRKHWNDEHFTMCLRFVAGLFDAQGFQIVSALDVLPHCSAGAGSIVAGWDGCYASDLTKADYILSLIAQADVTQAVVVEGGLVLGIETLQGTDALLGFVSQTQAKLRNRAQKGILVKRPKSGQDLRFDIPCIGPKTVEQVANAGLAGIVISPKTVLLLERDKLTARAEELGIFIHVTEPAL